MLPSAPTQLLCILSFCARPELLRESEVLLWVHLNSLWNTANGLKAVRDFPQYHYFYSTLWWQERNGWKSELWETPVGLETGQARTTFFFLCCYALRLVLWKVVLRLKSVFCSADPCAHVVSFIRTGSWFCIFVAAYLWLGVSKSI